MTLPAVSLREELAPYVERGAVPGLVALVDSPSGTAVEAVGRAAHDGPPVARDSLFRIASAGKPITAALVLMLVEDGRLGLDQPVGDLLPELAEPRVLRHIGGPLDDTVPAERPITLRHLLTFTAGLGFPTVESPVVGQYVEQLAAGPTRPDAIPATEEWLARLGRLPLLHQPGEGWAYDLGSDVLGVLVARASGERFGDVLADRLFEPLGMADTGFWVAADRVGRLTSLYAWEERPEGRGQVEVDPPAGQWSRPPAFESGAGGLVSSADDLLAFGRMLLSGGRAGAGRLLGEESVRLMTTDHLDDAQRAMGGFFLDGQGWGFGGSVDISESSPWNVPGRYGWVGGTGTSFHVDPVHRRVSVLLTAVELDGPDDARVLEAFWSAAHRR